MNRPLTEDRLPTTQEDEVSRISADVYPSRKGTRPRFMDRKDPVVYGGVEDGPLSYEELNFYEKNGYLFLEGFFSDSEVEDYREELARLSKEGKGSTRPEYITEPENEEVRSVFAIHEHNEVFKKLTYDPRIIERVQQILNSEVYIHQSRINFKPGFNGKEFYWHSDFETWHVEDGMPRMRALSCSIALEDNYSFNGPLMVLPGSQNVYVSCPGETPENNYESSLKRQEIGVPDHDSLREMVNKYGIDVPVGKKGSLLLFDCNVMHGSNGNITPYPRSNVFMVYNSVDNKLVKPYSGQSPRPDYIAHRD